MGDVHVSILTVKLHLGDVHIGLLTLKLLLGFVTSLFIVRITGRTSINQLTPFHLVYVMALGDFLGNAVFENNVGVLAILYALGVWTLFMIGLEFVILKKRTAREAVEGKPVIIIRDGILDRKLLQRNKVDVDQVLSLLRQNGVFSVREVKFGILEVNGQLSTLLQSGSQPPVKSDLKLPASPVHLPCSLIKDGKVLSDNLKKHGFDRQWLQQELSAKGYRDEKEIFYAEWREGEGMHVSPK